MDIHARADIDKLSQIELFYLIIPQTESICIYSDAVD